MKRSEVIVLGAIGLLMTAAFWPSNQQKLPPEDPALSSGDGFQTLAFASLDECKAAQAVTAQTCELEFGKSEQVSVADAPKFEALKDCETEYGANQCRPALWNGASVFVPALAGVLIARSLASAAARSQPLYPPRIGPASCPPGVSVVERPECAPRSASSGSSGGSSGSSSSGRSYYSTGTGRTIGRVAASFAVDAVLSSRSPVSRSAVSRSTSFSSPSSSGTSVSRSSTSSPSPTVSRSGFGSTGRSMSSSS